MRPRTPPLLATLAACITLTPAAVAAPQSAPPTTDRAPILKIVTQIQRADYEGDRPALARLYADLAPFIDENSTNKSDAASATSGADNHRISRIRYWRGFALWRRAINGFNETVEAKIQQQDFHQAIDEFTASASKDPAFVDAKIAAGSCLTFLAYGLGEKDPARIKDLSSQASTLLKEAQATAPDNPRLLWVVGAIKWYAPPERGGGQEVAMKMYDQGLAWIRAHKSDPTDPLDPTWGEPELLMNLAWSEQNRTTPDLSAAERDARSAIALVPYWHYVRDILLPQILAAKSKST
jgi:hypothetical protein